MLRRHAFGTFDTFNSFIIKGTPAAGVGQVYETLMTSPMDDILTEYGLIAESVEVPEDLSHVTYNLRPEARFHDGAPVTADDVIWTFETLKEKGEPFYRFYYKNIARAVKLGEHRVKFEFSGPPNRELPQITGQLPVLSKAWWSTRDFTKTTLESPMGSGPYRISSFEPGRYVEVERVKDWWGARLPINVGRHIASAMTIIATRPLRWKPSRPAGTTFAPRTTPWSGPPVTTSRQGNRAK
jgi:microcin C transport system substrate-binding protein